MSTTQKTNGDKQQLKIDITSDNICRKLNIIIRKNCAASIFFLLIKG